VWRVDTHGYADRNAGGNADIHTFGNAECNRDGDTDVHTDC
jgi:hypothetical protein